MPGSRFETCLDFVLRWEGGFGDDPDDAGGATNLGITQTEYDDYRAGKSEAKQSVRHISHAEAQDIYIKNYWIPLKCEAKPHPLDLAVFDGGVNMGVVTAVKMLQKCLGVKADGDFGAKSQAALDATKDHAAALTKAFQDAREARYRAIVAKKPSQEKFLKGWLNRVNDLRHVAGV